MTPSRVFAALAAVLVAIALLVLRPPGEPGVAQRDFEAYYSAGATWLAHGDPYSMQIWETERAIPGVIASRHEVLPFVGPPPTLMIWSLFAHLTFDRARLVWSALLVFSFALIVLLASRLLGLSQGTAFVVAVAALSFVPMTSDFGLGQAAMPAYAAALVALALPPLWNGLAMALCALQPNVAFGLLALANTRKQILAFLVAALALFIAGTLAAGAQWIQTYAHALREHAAAERFAAIQYTPAATLYGFGLPENASLAIGVGIAIIAGALALWGALRERSLVARFCMLSCAIPFVAGFFHEHDFVALFVPALFALIKSARPWVATLALVLCGVNWLDFAQQPQAASQDLVLAVALIAAALAMRPERSQGIAVLASAALLVAGAWIGATHHLPIWPNDMQGAAAGATVAQVWKNEQLQTGLLRPDAAAAALRSFALLGAALLLWLTLDIDVHHVVERRDRVGLEVL